jgi:tRNA pseudouridine38-40 synthase
LHEWRLTLEYEGTRYRGWQEQKNATTVAGELRRAAEDYLGRPIDLVGAGRTDAGVHALAQVARLRAGKPARPVELLRALNDRLPADINLLRVEPLSAPFDPRRDAIARYYIYQIATRRTAFAKRFVWWVKDRLDLALMQAASGLLAGRHDLSSFREERDDERSSVVAVERAELEAFEDLLLFRIGASHFLWKMVRRIVGALVEVGRGSLTVEEFGHLLAPGRAAATAARFQVAKHTAPPSGLFLERVVYKGGARPGALTPAFPVRAA